MFVKVAVQEIPPLTLVATRVSLAALMLYFVLRSQRRALPAFGPIWKHFAVVGLLSNALPFTLLSWGELYIDSALAAILVGTTPLFTLILAHLFIADERLNLTKAGGVLVGFSGLIVLVAPALFSGVQATVLGLLAATAAAASYGAGIVYTRQNLRGLPPLVGPTAQLTMAALYLLPVSFVVERPYTLSAPSWQVVAALLLLAVICTALAFVVYYRVMEQTSATNLSLITYMIPVVATVLGVVVLNEQIGWNAYLGCMLILLGVMVVNGALASLRRSRWFTVRRKISRPLTTFSK